MAASSGFLAAKVTSPGRPPQVTCPCLCFLSFILKSIQHVYMENGSQTGPLPCARVRLVCASLLLSFHFCRRRQWHLVSCLAPHQIDLQALPGTTTLPWAAGFHPAERWGTTRQPGCHRPHPLGWPRAPRPLTAFPPRQQEAPHSAGSSLPGPSRVWRCWLQWAAKAGSSEVSAAWRFREIPTLTASGNLKAISEVLGLWVSHMGKDSCHNRLAALS